MFKGLPKGQQLRGLKRQGVVSISRVANRAVVLASVLVAFLVVAPRLPGEIERSLKQGISTAPITVVHVLVFVVMASSLSVLIGATLSTTLQSQGALGWNVLRRTRRQPKGFVVIGAYVATLVVMIVTATAVIFVNLGDFLNVPRLENPSQAFVAYGTSLADSVKLVVVGALVCAILGAILTRFFFLVKNRVRSDRGAG